MQYNECLIVSCEAPLQLQGGPTFGEGQLSVYNDVTSSWQPVCAVNWTLTNARVACRQLGFTDAALSAGPTHYFAQSVFRIPESTSYRSLAYSFYHFTMRS